MFVTGIMGLKKFLLLFGIFVVIPAYLVYTPIPDGYSVKSACEMQLILATVKSLTAVVRTFSKSLHCFGNISL